jgi:predicted nucleic acid-binding protein
LTAVRQGSVLDASVALAALLDEPLVAFIPTLLAAAARDPAVRLAVPAASDGECAAGLVRAVRRGRLARDTDEEAWLDLLELPLERIASLTSVFAPFGYGPSARRLSL